MEKKEPPPDAALSPEPPGDRGPRDEELAEIEEEELTEPAESVGDMPAGSVRAYLKEIGKIPLLDADSELRLAQKVSAGKLAREMLAGLPADPDPESVDVLENLASTGDRAKKQMAEANLRLVASIAKRYARNEMPFLDLVQEGNIGLLTAIEKFDPSRGCRFSTYAIWWIRHGITRAIADQTWAIRVPTYMAEMIAKITRASRRLEWELGRNPSPEEIAGKLGLPVNKVLDAMNASRTTMSLDTPVGEDGESSLGDFIPDDGAWDPADTTVRTILQEQVAEALDTLEPREARVMRLRFGFEDGLPRTLEAIGSEYGLTRECIRQIEAKALRKLRSPAWSRKLKDFYE